MILMECQLYYKLWRMLHVRKQGHGIVGGYLLLDLSTCP